MGILKNDGSPKKKSGPRPGTTGKVGLLKKRVSSKIAVAYNATNPSDPVIGLYKQSVIVAKLNEHKGKLSSTANSLGVTLATIQGYIKKSKKLQECLITFNEVELDNAEEKLQKQIEKENLAAIQFYLKCKGKDRGWTEKTEMSIELSKPITFRYTVAKPKEVKK